MADSEANVMGSKQWSCGDLAEGYTNLMEGMHEPDDANRKSFLENRIQDISHDV